MKPLSLGELPSVGPAAVSMGVWDGVHRGHRRLMDATVAAARRTGSAAVALVFDPHPDEVVRPGTAMPRLTAMRDARAQLVEAGIDHALPIRFDDRLRALTPEAFLAALGPALELRAIAMTPDSAFGRGRTGTIDRVRQIAAQAGFDVVEVALLTDDGAPISSTRVRDAVARGDLATATRLLGRPHAVRGVVVRGDRRGHELGYPTANLAFDHVAQLPALGIYTGRVEVAERNVGPGHPALVSVGVRPTFHEDGRVLVEVHLLDWDGDLYDATLRLELLERLRDERRFDDVAALVRQMHDDERVARDRLGMGP